MHVLMNFSATDKIARSLNVQKSTVDTVALVISGISAGLLGGFMAFGGVSGIGYDVGVGIFSFMFLKYAYTLGVPALNSGRQVAHMPNPATTLPKTPETPEEAVKYLDASDDPLAYRQLSESLQKVDMVARKAVQKGYGSAYHNMSEEGQKEEAFALRAMQTDYTVVDKVLRYFPYQQGTGNVSAARIGFWADAIKIAGQTATIASCKLPRPGKVVADTVFGGDLRVLLKGAGAIAKAYKEVMERAIPKAI